MFLHIKLVQLLSIWKSGSGSGSVIPNLAKSGSGRIGKKIRYSPSFIMFTFCVS